MKENVRFSGPKHPWLVRAYSKVPFPCGNVFGEEIFQSGVIPSDTDFRIFRDYGQIPGKCDALFFVHRNVLSTIYADFTHAFSFYVFSFRKLHTSFRSKESSVRWATSSERMLERLTWQLYFAEL